MADERDDNQCKHELCTCAAAADSNYCSPHCETAAASNANTIACNCNHAGCGGEITA